jgi:uncharacterized membrane protein
MTDLSKSPFVPKTEFYTTATAIWIAIAVIAGDLARSSSFVVAVVLSILASVLSIAFSVLAISCAAEARRKRAASGGESS